MVKGDGEWSRYPIRFHTQLGAHRIDDAGPAKSWQLGCEATPHDSRDERLAASDPLRQKDHILSISAEI
jgi:hypothetical protein